MQKYPYWETIYFDGFVGSGTKEKIKKSPLYLQLNITPEEEKVYKGAAERVLDMQDNLGFDYYYFIDKDKKSIEVLKDKFSDKKNEGKIIYRKGDANQQLKKLSEALKTKKFAALVLLDPFGLQIDWESIKNLKDTRSDVWILIPTGVIVNRLLDRKGALKYSEKLESFFGLSIDEIKSYFYHINKVPTLFGDEREEITKVSQPIEKIANLYADRLSTIWTYVTKQPLVLKNRNGVPIYHFVFASNNKTAFKIAKQIIQDL